MKRLFTLIALLTCIMGAKAAKIVDAEVDFSKYTDISEWNFPYSNGGSESAKARLSIKDGCLHFESTEATDPFGDCAFFPIGGVDAEPGVTYTLHYKVKGNHNGYAQTQGFGLFWVLPITTEWVEGTIDYKAESNDGNINLMCGDWIGSFDIAYLRITHEHIEWVEMLTNGDAETPWAEPNLPFNDMDKNYLICAWGKEKGVNMDNPFPATIEPEEGNPSNHVFVVHGKVADEAWDNNFWIQSPRAWKAGSQVKVSFRYKASKAVTVATQCNKQTPSDYLMHRAIGDISFTEEWQEYSDIMTIQDDMDGTWSICFNLNQKDKDAIDFYFDDLSWQGMKLDEGLFVAASNADTGLEYDFDNAIELVYDEGLEAYVGTVGTVGNQDSWVNQVMISTVRGNDKAFKGATIKPSGIIDGTEDTWLYYTESPNTAINLPAAGVWQVAVDTETKQVNFYQIEGVKLEVYTEFVEETGTLTYYYDGKIEYRKGVTEVYDPNATRFNGYKNDVQKAAIDPSMKDAPLTSTKNMFYDLRYMTSIEGLENLNTSGVTNMESMFENCMSLETLDIMSFDISNVTSFMLMFSQCTHLKTIYCYGDWSSSTAQSKYMFDSCYELCGGKGTTFTSSVTDKAYARPDGGTEAPGYFTAEKAITGDLNGDGKVDIADAVTVLNIMAAGEYKAEADINGDNKVDIADFVTILNIMAAQ